MTFKLRSQPIDMFPLKGDFIESGVRGDIVYYEVQLLALYNVKRSCFDFPERCIISNTAISKEFQYLTCLVQTLVAFDAVLIHTLLGSALSFISIASDVINKAVDQIVMESLIAIVNET